jgi:hypothetical protein
MAEGGSSPATTEESDVAPCRHEGFRMQRVLLRLAPKYSARPNELSGTGLWSKTVVGATAVLVFAMGLNMPIHNWDMVAYTAAAYHLDGLRGIELQSATLADIASEVTPAKFQETTTGAYKATFFRDPNSLEQNVPFYTIKIVYLELMRLLKRMGVAYPAGSYYISAFFASISIILIGALSAHFGVSLFWTPFIAAFSGFHNLPRYSTPDAMACFLALLTVYLLLNKKRVIYIISVLAPLIRTDLVLLSIIAMISIYYIERSRYSIIFGVLAILSYAGVNDFAGSYGYITLFNFTFIGIDPYPRDMKLSVQPWAYLQPYIDCARVLLFHERHTILYALTFYMVYVIRPYKARDLLIAISIASSYAFMHIALFPVYDERFFAFPASLICISLLAMLYGRHKPASGLADR